MLAAFLRALGTLVRVDLLPAGEVDRLDAAGCEQTVDGFRIAVNRHATTLGGLGQVLEHVGDDEQRVGLGGSDQADRATLGPTGGVQTLTHLRALAGRLGGDTAVAIRIGQVSATIVVCDARRGSRLVADRMVHGLHRILLEFAGAGHLAIGAGLGLLHADANDLAVLAQHFDRRGIEVDVVLAVRRIAFEIGVSVVFHVFGHLTNGKQLLDHLTGQLVLAGLLDGVVVQIEIVLVDDQLHTRQLLHLTQLLHGELGLGHATADEQVQGLGLVGLDTLVHVVRNVGFGFEIVGVAHELARHVHGHVAAADHGDLFGVERPFAGAGRITVIPFHELCGTVHAVQIRSRQAERLVLHRAGGEQHGVVAFEQLVERHVLAEFHVAVQVDVRVVEGLLERGRDEFDGWMVGGHAVAYQAERHRQLFKQVDAGLGAQAELLAKLLELAQEDVGRVDACRAGADYSDTKFLSFSHAL